MTARTDHDVQDTDTDIDFDSPARKGWGFFTRFLLWNVVAAAGGLIFIAALTVWR